MKPVIGIFSENTVAALRRYKDDLQIEDGTIFFVELISLWWKIVNVKRTLTDIRKRDPFCAPITSMECQSVNFLKRFASFLDAWSQDGFVSLSDMTMSAMKLTMTSLLNLIQYLLSLPSFQFILLGKFQSDVIESRFGEYRQLGGSRYHVTASCVLQAEKKIRLQYLVSRTKSHGSIHVQLSDLKMIEEDSPTIDSFQCDIPDSILELLVCDLSAPEEDTVVFIAGYIQRSLERTCSSCKSVEQRCDPSPYIQEINRGGLIMPSQALLELVDFWLRLFKQITREHESLFFNHATVRSFLCSILLYFTDFEGISLHINSDNCFRRSIFTFANIILKDFINLKNRKHSEKKAQKINERKIKKLSS